jgi:molybdenum cofactor guanylyltransferase
MSGNVGGIVLAGGLSRRMGGGDKGLAQLAGRPMLAHVVERARAQTAVLLLNGNGDADRFAEFELPVAADVVPGFAGPLAGILTGLEWLRTEHPGLGWLASFACDSPLLPADLVARLWAAVTAEGAHMACATSGGRLQPVFGLWPVTLAESLRHAVVEDGIRSVGAFAAGRKLARVDWPAGDADPFVNINTPEELERVEQLLTAAKAEGHCW